MLRSRSDASGDPRATRLLSRSRIPEPGLWQVRAQETFMNCARLRLNAATTTILVRDGWLIIEASDAGEFQTERVGASRERLLTVAEVSHQTGFTAGAVRDWIKRSVLPAVRVGKEYRVRESDLAKLLDGSSPETVSLSQKIGRRRKAISV